MFESNFPLQPLTDDIINEKSMSKEGVTPGYKSTIT